MSLDRNPEPASWEGRPARGLAASGREARANRTWAARPCHVFATLLCVVALLGAGCRPGGAARGNAATEEAMRGYPVTGRVIAILAERGTLLVDHDEIPGYMPRMTMEFHVGAGDFAIAKEGAELRARLIEAENGTFRLENIWWQDAVADSAVRQAADRLREDTRLRGRSAYREVGENLPDFALYTHNGEVAQAARWRGKQILLNFIYTRCPIPTMCPLATSKMMEAQEKAREAGVANLELVSITLDPEYDTPGVLREYAEARGIDTSNFTFLTGPEGAIRDLLKQFGVLSELDGPRGSPLIRHTLTTLLIDETGKIAWRADGSQWSPAEFVAKMKR